MTDFEYYYSDAMYVSEALDGLLMLFTLAFLVTGYVLCSLGLYAIARRRGIRKAWLAWVPVGDLWLLGSISDQYRYLVKGRVNNRRRILVILSFAVILLYVLGAYCILTSDGAVMGVLLAFFAILALVAAVITLAVYQYMCCYDLFCSCDRDNGALYLIMCFLFSGVMPFLVFACRKKDEGMPPRKQPIPQPVQAPVQEEPQVTEEEKETEGGTPDEQTIPVADA